MAANQRIPRRHQSVWQAGDGLIGKRTWKGLFECIVHRLKLRGGRIGKKVQFVSFGWAGFSVADKQLLADAANLNNFGHSG